MLSFLRILLGIFVGAALLTQLSGCGHVSANYPQKSPSKGTLPTHYKTPFGSETTLVWTDPGRVQGFLSHWRDTSYRAGVFWNLAANSGLPVHKEAAQMYDELSAAGISEACLWAFFAKGVELPCRTGDFEVEFSDGTKVRDEGVLYVQTQDSHKPYRYTEENKLKLSREIMGRGEALRMLIFLPTKHLNKQIVEVVYLPSH